MKFLDEFKKLRLPPEEFVIFGSACLAIRGLCENNDIDIVVGDKLWKELKKKYPLCKKDVLRLSEHVECFNVWPDGFEFDSAEELIKSAEAIDGIRFSKLETILRWKKIRMEKKDKEHIEKIEKFLRTI